MGCVAVYGHLVALAAAMGGFLVGYEMGVVGQLMGMDSFNIKFGLKRDERINLTRADGVVFSVTYKQLIRMEAENDSLFDDLYGFGNDNISFPETRRAPDIMGSIPLSLLIGCIVGAAIASKLADFLGRRFSIFMGTLFYMVGVAMQTGSSNLPVLLIGRVVAGCGVGLLSMVVPLYISETAQTAVRGRLITVFQLMAAFGILVKCAVNSALLSFLTGPAQWRLALGLPMIPGVVVALVIIILPYSPRWLIDHNRDDEGVKTLAKLRNKRPDDHDLLVEFATIKEAVQYEKDVGHATWLELLQPGIRNRVGLGITLQFFQQWSGCNVMLYYGGKVFSAIGMPAVHAFITLIVINAALNFLATFLAMWWVERLGRKVLLVVGGFLMWICHALIATFLGLSDNLENSLYVYGAIVAIYLYTITFASTWGPVVWVYQSEIFPMRVRAKGTSLCTMSSWTWNAIVAKLTPIMLASITYYTNAVFSVFCFVTAIFVWFCVPETKGQTLETMSEVFGATPDEAHSPDDQRDKKIRKIVMVETEKIRQEEFRRHRCFSASAGSKEGSTDTQCSVKLRHGSF